MINEKERQFFEQQDQSKCDEGANCACGRDSHRASKVSKTLSFLPTEATRTLYS